MAELRLETRTCDSKFSIPITLPYLILLLNISVGEVRENLDI